MASSYTPLRYPGGKGKLSNFMKLVMLQNRLCGGDYIEPYAGGAGMAITLLLQDYVSTIHLNDIDPIIYAFWKSALFETDKLCKLILKTEVSVAEWERQRNIIKNRRSYSTLKVGFAAFFLNRTNRSGILKGGVIGGRNQKGTWKIDARFTKDTLVSRISKIGQYRKRIRLYNMDAGDFIKQILPGINSKSIVYLDPPYYLQGRELYENHYKEKDHAEVAKLVGKRIKQHWVVSYDNTPAIKKLYSDFRKKSYGINYSAQNHYKGRELMFFSDKLQLPKIKNPLEVNNKMISAYL